MVFAGMTFERWMGEVDLFVKDNAGCSIRDLPDWEFRAAYNRGREPEDTALELLEHAGLL